MNQLSIGLKLGIGFVMVLIMFITVSISSYRNIQQVNEGEAWVKHTNDILLKTEHIKGHLRDAEAGQRGYLITGLEQDLKSYNQAVAALPKNIEALKVLTLENANQQGHISELNPKVEQKLNELEQAINLRKTSGFDAAKVHMLKSVDNNVMEEIHNLLTSIEEEANYLLEEKLNTNTQSSNKAINTIIWVTTGACIVVLLLLFYYVKTIASPIKKLSDIAESISKGKLTVRDEDINSKDELGGLLNSFKLMQQYLQLRADQANCIADGDLSIEVKPISEDDIMGVAFTTMIERLRQQIASIADGVQVLSSSSIEIMATVSQLSSTTAETSTSISETTTTVEEVKQTAEVSNQRAVEVSDSAQKISSISQDGFRSIQDTIEGMNKIKHQMESIAGIVIQLSEKSHTIGEIATTVNDLSEQSNLLAVNASIEAAKAGEQGKGFSVVAQEIKNLAERSKESTIQIRSILADIQKEISSAVMATEQGGKVIDSALELSSSASEVITTLAASIEQAAQANIQIAASSQQQLTGMDQITIAMESINEASMQVSNGTRQTEASVAQLNDLGNDLQMIMNQYKLK